MTKPNRINLVLGLIAALLTLILIAGAPQPEINPNQLLTDLDPQQVESIHLALGNGQAPTLQLTRKAEGWALTAPVQMPADDMAIGEILRLLTLTSARRIDPEQVDLAAIRMDPPLWRVSLDEQTFEIGGREALSGDRYVQHRGQIHLLADLNPARLDNNYADLVSRRLLFTDAQIQSIRLPDQDVTMLQDDSAELFARWRNAEAQWLVRPSKLDFEDVRQRVTVTLENASVDFLIRSREPRLELIRPDLDLMYMLPASASQELLGH